MDERVPAALLQSDSAVRFEWGQSGTAALASSVGCVVVVDVLSFSTAVSVVVGRGTEVLAHPVADPDATLTPADLQTEIAVPRAEISPEHPWTLSPADLATGPLAERLLLPSPNGAAIAGGTSGLVLACCLRNRDATFRWLAEHGIGTTERPLLVVAAGERWPEGSLRPSLEDAIGAGALLSRFQERDYRLSTEASAMAALYEATGDVHRAVIGSATGLELAGRGYGRDVEMAAELDVDDWAAVREGGAFARA